MLPDHAIDSTAARERREAQAEAEAEGAALDRLHTTECVDGWLGLDAEGRPRPCPRCRTHLMTAPCRVCGIPEVRCSDQRAIARGRCCDACDHPGGHA